MIKQILYYLFHQKKFLMKKIIEYLFYLEDYNLEDYNRYRAEIFSVYSTFNKLSNGISFVFVA